MNCFNAKCNQCKNDICEYKPRYNEDVISICYARINKKKGERPYTDLSNFSEIDSIAPIIGGLKI
jgi:hypothetical protein